MCLTLCLQHVLFVLKVRTFNLVLSHLPFTLLALSYSGCFFFFKPHNYSTRLFPAVWTEDTWSIHTLQSEASGYAVDLATLWN